jgi:hypothetical protein
MLAVKVPAHPVRITDDLFRGVSYRPCLLARQERTVLVNESLFSRAPYIAFVTALDLLDHEMIEMAGTADNLVALADCCTHYAPLTHPFLPWS